MSANGGGSSFRRVNWTLFWTAVGALATVAALLLAIGVFPSSESENSESPAAKSDRGDREDDSASRPSSAPPAGEELWSGEVSLVVNEQYALDGFPIEPYEGYCDGCLMVNGFTPELSLEVENGIRDWVATTPPSYEDCVQLLESGPAPSVTLVTSPNSEGLAVGDWACAYSKSGEILRLRYRGASEDEVNYRFAVTGWRQPS